MTEICRRPVSIICHTDDKSPDRSAYSTSSMTRAPSRSAQLALNLARAPGEFGRIVKPFEHLTAVRMDHLQLEALAGLVAPNLIENAIR